MAKRHPNRGSTLQDWFKEEAARDPGFLPYIEAGRRRAALAVKIRKLREARGWSQAQLAEKARLHQPGIARLENGRTETSVATLDKVAAALGCTLAVDLTPRRRRH